MASYISSNDNRVYAATESSFGSVASVTGANRIPAVSLAIRSEAVVPARRDKTGTRTKHMVAAPLRRNTSYVLKSYLSSWGVGSGTPSWGPLIAAGLGSPARVFAGGAADSTPGPKQIRFAAPHALLVGQAITYAGEMRFVTGLIDEYTVELNASFSTTPGGGALIGGTATYMPASELASVSLLDYWSPDGAVQRIVRGAAVDRLRISLNGDYHEMEFRGPAADVIDGTSFSGGQGGLSSFPVEPPIQQNLSQPVPGFLGQAWMGAIAEQYFTVTGATLTVDNNIDVRNREYGSQYPRCFSAGVREVMTSLSLFQQDNSATRALYQAARSRSPIQMMYQMGQAPGQLMGVFLKSVIVDVPEFDDGETRVEWKFSNAAAQGIHDDEIIVAFG